MATQNDRSFVAGLFALELNNDGRGYLSPICALVPVLVAKTLIAVNFSGLNPFIDVAEILLTADGIPVDQFSPEARFATVDLAKAWGAAMLALCAICWLVIVRYRTGLPIVILALLLEQGVRTGDGLVTAATNLISGHGASVGGMINLGMTALLVLALVLALAFGRARKPE